MYRTLKLILSSASALALVAVTATPAVAAKPSDKSRGQSETKKYSGSSQHSSSSHAAPRSNQGASQGSTQRSAPTVRGSSGSHSSQGSIQRSAPSVRSAPTVRSAPSVRSAPTVRSAPSTQRGPSVDHGRSLSTPRYESHGRSTQATPAPRSFDPRERSSHATPPSTGRREVERQQPTRGPRIELPQRDERGAKGPQGEIRGRGDEPRGGSSQQGWNDREGRQDVRDLGRPGSRADARSGSDSRIDRGSDSRSIVRDKDGRSYDTSRSHDREGARRWESNDRYDRKYAGKPTQRVEGTVQRYERSSGGYRVWTDGGHCFFVPDYRWNLWPLRIGLFVTFGGYWNPLGYYNVYDYGYGPYWGAIGGFGGYGGYYGGYSGGYYGGGGSYPSRPYTNNATTYVEGYVDRFDDYDGGFVVRDDRTGRYVSVYMKYDDPQFRYLQVGNWVTLAGAWTRDGYFEVYRIHDVR